MKAGSSFGPSLDLIFSPDTASIIQLAPLLAAHGMLPAQCQTGNKWTFRHWKSSSPRERRNHCPAKSGQSGRAISWALQACGFTLC